MSPPKKKAGIIINVLFLLFIYHGVTVLRVSERCVRSYDD
jgi:hypothetical protein